MVEKIIINPNKVRGYGNIMSPHSTSDYETYASSLTSGTDTVNGQTMTVYELEDTILFFDYGVTNNYTDWYNNGNRATITRDDTGTKFYYETLNTSGNITLQARPGNTEYWITSSNFVVEFDIVEMSDDRNQRIQIGNSSNSANLYLYASRGFSSGKHIKFEVINQTITTYIDGVQTGDIYSFTGTGNIRVIYQALTVGDYLKFKNFKIYGG